MDKDVKIIKGYLLVIIFVLSLIFGRLVTGVAIAGAETMYVTVSEDSYLNGRERPDKHSQALCRFASGDEVNVLDIQDGWAKLDYGGEAEYSFVSLDYLSSSPEGSKTMHVAANGRVRIREKPDDNGETVGYVRDGDSVTVSLIFGGWAKTPQGWINTTYLED